MFIYFGSKRAAIRGQSRPGLSVDWDNLALARTVDDNLLRGLARIATELLDLLDNVQALDDLAEDDVLAIEPASLGSAEEELGAVPECGGLVADK